MAESPKWDFSEPLLDEEEYRRLLQFGKQLVDASDEGQTSPISTEIQHDAGGSTTAPESTVFDSANSIQAGTMIGGRYQLLQPIAEGGMGSVWLAQQSQPVKRKLAIKLIKAGMDSRQVLARFGAERQSLALMNHPNVTRIIDAGTTRDGQPFFAMELVDGLPFTQYCDQNRLSVNERLRLFCDVCAGVQHAHQKGIIHRDLKPSNILVAEIDGLPLPKVIDFGLAKALESAQSLTDHSLQTVQGQLLGTLKYMSPEQASLDLNDIDTRTDIYSLGVILYEVLIGCAPLDGELGGGEPMLELLQRIREKEPIRPSIRLGTDQSVLSTITELRCTDSSSLRRILSGDLDWIVMKALDKDRAQRYGTVSEFAKDVQRYLTNEPVQARPPSAVYRIRKFASKNRTGVFAAGIVVTTLVAGIIGTTWGLFRADSARREAEKQQARAEQREQMAIEAVNRFGDSVANNSDLKGNPSLESLRKTLMQEPLGFFEQLRDQLQRDGDTRPESLLKLSMAAFKLGDLHDEIGDHKRSLLAYKQSLKIQERLAREYPVRADHLGGLAASQSRVKPVIRDYYATSQHLGGLAVSQSRVADLLRVTGRSTESLAAYRRAMEYWERLALENPTVPKYQDGWAASLNNLGNLYLDIGKPSDALTAFQRALEINNRLVRQSPADSEFQRSLAGGHFGIGNLFSAIGQRTEALAAYQRALEIQEQLVRDNPEHNEDQFDLANSLNNIGAVQKQIGNPIEALAANQRALAIREGLARTHPTTTEYQMRLSDSYYNLGALYRDTGKPDKAIDSYQEALEIREHLAHDHLTVPQFQADAASCHHSIGIVLKDMGKPAEALAAYQRALEIQEQLADEYPTVEAFRVKFAKSLRNVGGLLEVQGRSTEALETYQRVMGIRERLANENPTNSELQFDFAQIHLNIGSLFRNTGKPDEAVAAYQQALDVQEKLVSTNPDVPHYSSLLGGLLNDMAMVDVDVGQYAAAHQKLKRAIELQKRALAASPLHPTYRQFLRNHYRVLRRAAIGLDNSALLAEAERGIAE